MPSAADMLAHTFWKSNHLNEVHKHHGSQHVHSETAQAENDDAKGKNMGIKLVEPVAVHLVSKFSYNFSHLAFTQLHTNPYLLAVPAPPSDVISPPPKSSSFDFC